MQAGVSDLPTTTTTANRRTAVPARRARASTVVAAGVAAALFASAGPAAAINPGGGRHRVHTAPAQHSNSRAHSATKDSMSPELQREFYRLRVCESGNNYRDNTGNGYYGAYQFALQTWHNLGMSGRPDQAAPELQDHAAYVLYKRAGWSPWPACSQREHLRRID